MINLNLGTLIFQIINFLVMAFILTRFFFRPVMRILDERSKKVTSALDEAEQREREAAGMRAQYEQRLAEAQEQVIVMRQRAQEELERAKRLVLAETRDEIQAMREKAEHDVEEARQQAVYQHRRDLAHVATTMGEQLVREAGGDAFQKASIEQFVEQLSALPASSYRRALEDRGDESIRVQVASARELDIDSMARIERQVQEMAGEPVKVNYTVDPALIAGATMRFGDVMIDGSLAGQFEGLSERFLTAQGQGEI